MQRTYPQIYKSTDRLLIKPEEISVSARDFVLSAKSEPSLLNELAYPSSRDAALIPSTARSTSSVAAPLPSHLQPLLGPSLDRAKQVLSKVLPDVKKVNILEEAQYVQDEGGFEHEQMLQSARRSFKRSTPTC